MLVSSPYLFPLRAFLSPRLHKIDTKQLIPPQGQWNTKRFKWYHRCFAVDLKQFDLGIAQEEKQKRGMQEKEAGTKKLLNEIEAWVEIYKIADVKGEDVGKFTWL